MSRGFDRVSRSTVYLGRVEQAPPWRIRGRHVIAGLIVSLVIVLSLRTFSESVVIAPDETPKDTASKTEVPPPALPDMCVVHIVDGTCYVQDAESGCFPDCPADRPVVNGPPPPIRKVKVAPARKRAGHPKRVKPASMPVKPTPKPAAPAGPTVPA